MSRRPFLLTAFVALLGLAGCGSGGNVKTADDFDPPTPVKVLHPYFNPYARTGDGQVPATWRAPVRDYDGTIVRPADPQVDRSRPDYEHAPWFVGGAQTGPTAGTF